MFLLFYITPLSLSFYTNLSIGNLRCNLSPKFLSKSPILIFPNLKITLLTAHLSDFFISKSDFHLLYANKDFKSIALNRFQINYFLSQPIYINKNDFAECPHLDRPLFTNNVFSITNCYFRDIYNYGTNIYASGAAMYIGSAVSIILSNVCFERCQSSNKGGAIFVEESNSVSIELCNFSQCSIADKDDLYVQSGFGSAFFICNSFNVSINKCNFLDNYMESNLPNKFKYTIVFSSCNQINLNGLFFNNDKNVQVDVYLSFYFNTNHNKNVEVSISGCCFLSKTINAIEVDKEQMNKEFSWYFCVKQNSFIQKEPLILTPNDPNEINIIENNFVNKPYCKFTEDFTQSSFFTSSDKFIPTSLFSSSSIFTASSFFLPSLIFTSSSKFEDTPVFSSSYLFSQTYEFIFSSNFISKFSSISKLNASSEFSVNSKFSSNLMFKTSSKFATKSIFADSHIFTGRLEFSKRLEFTSFSKSSNFSDSMIFLFVKEGDNNDKKSNKSIIYISVGICAGVIVIVAAIILIILFLKKYNKKEFQVNESYLNDDEYLQYQDDLKCGL